MWHLKSKCLILHMQIPNTPNKTKRFSLFFNDRKQRSSSKKKKNISLESLVPTQGLYWHFQGKQALEKNAYQEAIECFTKAIEIRDESRFYRYRGECYKRIGDYSKALQDSVIAIELDDKNISGHLLCGKVMAEIGKTESDGKSIETSITRFTKAYTLCSGKNKRYFEQELSKYIYRAKKLLWYKQREIALKEKQSMIQKYQVIYCAKQKEQNYLHFLGKSQEEIQTEMQQFISAMGDPQEKLKLEIPTYMICKISLEIMEEPALTEAGHCYEKELLVQHFKKNGGIDPFTRKPIRQIFYSAFNVKQSIEYFLKNNPWAFEFKQDEEYKQIEF